MELSRKLVCDLVPIDVFRFIRRDDKSKGSEQGRPRGREHRWGPNRSPSRF